MSEVKGGLTARCFLILTFLAFITSSINIWANISIGTTLLSSYALIVIAAQLSRFFGSPFTVQELSTLLVGMGAIQFNYGISRIFNAYFAQSPILSTFGIEKLPYWSAILPESGFYISRSFWHPVVRKIFLKLDDLLLPSLQMIAGLSLGILNKIIYVDEEKLPYPGVQVQAELCSTLAEGERLRMFIFNISFFTAFLYGVFIYILPSILPTFRAVQSLWFDLSYWLQLFLPGACLGVSVHLPLLLPGLYLPPIVIFSQLIGSIAVWIFGNWYIVTNGITEFSKIYSLGMPISHIYRWAYMYVWMMPMIGLAIFIGLSSLRPSIVARAFSTLRRSRASSIEARVFSIWLVIIPFACIVLSNLLSIWYWAPDYPMFPWLPAAFTIVISLAQSLLIGLANGTGVNVRIPENLDKLMLVATGYQGINGWLVSPVVISPSFGGYVDSNFKLSQLTRSSFTDYLKVFFLIGPVSVIFSILITQVLWGMAPIPSEEYPWSSVEWPRRVVERAIWITRPPGVFRLDWMIYGILLGAAIYMPLYLLHLPANRILVSLFAGMGTLPPMAISMVIGYCIRLILQRLIGKERFRNYRYTIVAGLAAGTGFSSAIGVSCLLIIRSVTMHI